MSCASTAALPAGSSRHGRAESRAGGVFRNQNEGWAGHWLVDAQTSSNAARQAGLAGAKVANQRQNIARLDRQAQAGQSIRLCFAER